MDLDLQKARARRELNARRRAMSPERRAEASRTACDRLSDLRAFPGKGVALYAALPDEVDTRPLFEALRARRLPCWLPRCTARDELVFARVDRWEELQPGRFGVLEPPADRASGGLHLDGVSWVVVPGVGFDLHGGRLGRGRGFYDRTFAATVHGEEPRLVGLAFDVQCVDLLPTGPHDRRMDAVVSEGGVRYALGGGPTA